MKRIAVAVYAVIAYGAFLLSVAWAIGFFADRGAPTSVDGPATRPAWAALAINGALLLAFAAQHTIMARDAFKQRLTRVIPASAERSTFVLAAGLVMFALFGWWQPVPTVVWHIGAPWSVAVWALYAVGWVIAVWSTFMIDHADFLGLKQAFSTGYRPPRFSQRWMYQYCRHPMMLGLLITFWATPRMTVGHAFFAVAASAYIAVGIRFEERSLRTHLGAEYARYAERVPAILPIPRSYARRAALE